MQRVMLPAVGKTTIYFLKPMTLDRTRWAPIRVILSYCSVSACFILYLRKPQRGRTMFWCVKV